MSAAPEARVWLTAAAREDVRREVESIHDEIERSVRSASPRCEQSGRCCRFEAHGHRLYVTGLEAALTVLRLREFAGGPGLDERSIDDAVERGGCPFQIGNLCGVHAIRPGGCRVYFCDPAWSAMQSDVAERAAQQVRELHDRRRIPYRYAEWRSLLRTIVAETGAIASRAVVNEPPSEGVRPTLNGAPL